MSKIPTINFTLAFESIVVAMRANTTVLLLGDPGVGKSALAKQVAEALELPLVTIIGSTHDATDIAGLPVVRADGKVERVLFEALARACDEPVLLFIDELSTCPLSVQAALYRVILERVVGDRHLHAGTRVIAASNPPEQAAGGVDLTAPLMGRFAVMKLRPLEAEVLEYFMSIGEDGSPLRAAGQEFAMTVSAFMALQPAVNGRRETVRLLQIDIPEGAVAGNVPWGSPRAWERVVRTRAVGAQAGASEDVLFALAAGSVGEECALAFSAIMRLQSKLPSAQVIAKDPNAAMVPDEPASQIAAIGIVARTADLNPWAAWIYASRLRAEVGAACAHALMQRKSDDTKLPWAKEGTIARVKLTASIKRLGA